MVQLVGAVGMVHIPTRRERLLRRLGFDQHSFTEMPESAENLPGWSMTEVRIHISFMDRLRLLVSGKAFMTLEQRHDVVVKHVVTASVFSVCWDWPR